MEELLHWAETEPTLRGFKIEWVHPDDYPEQYRFRVTVWSMKSDGSGPRREPTTGLGYTLGWAATRALQRWFDSYPRPAEVTNG